VAVVKLVVKDNANVPEGLAVVLTLASLWIAVAWDMADVSLGAVVAPLSLRPPRV
jgi:hypothetical protein